MIALTLNIVFIIIYDLVLRSKLGAGIHTCFQGLTPPSLHWCIHIFSDSVLLDCGPPFCMYSWPENAEDNPEAQSTTAAVA